MATQEDIYGLFVSQLGHDAATAADQDMIMSSDFPTLKIYRKVRVTIAASPTTPKTLFTHNLGYAPFFLAWKRRSTNASFLQGRFDVDGTKITYTPNAFYDGTGNIDITLMVCRNPLNNDITTRVFRTQSIQEAARNRDYGLIISKEGKDVSSADIRDFNFHSDTRNFLIHRVFYERLEPFIPADTLNIRALWTNDLPYNPIHFGFLSLDNGATFRSMFGNEASLPGFAQDANGDLSIGSQTSLGADQYASIFVFKDPFDSGDTTVVTI